MTSNLTSRISPQNSAGLGRWGGRSCASYFSARSFPMCRDILCDAGPGSPRPLPLQRALVRWSRSFSATSEMDPHGALSFRRITCDANRRPPFPKRHHWLLIWAKALFSILAPSECRPKTKSTTGRNITSKIPNAAGAQQLRGRSPQGNSPIGKLLYAVAIAIAHRSRGRSGTFYIPHRLRTM